MALRVEEDAVEPTIDTTTTTTPATTSTTSTTSTSTTTTVPVQILGTTTIREGD
jgi:hypothetical protein